MECLTQCLGGNTWVIVGVVAVFYVVSSVVDAIPATWVVQMGPVPVPLGRILHGLAGNFVRALRKAPGGDKLPIELPAPK